GGTESGKEQTLPAAGPGSTQMSAVITGAERFWEYLPLLKGKKVGFMGNQTSVAGGRHLVDVLIEKGVDLKFAFAPEHGFRGNIERGEKVDNTVDARTGLS